MTPRSRPQLDCAVRHPALLHALWGPDEDRCLQNQWPAIGGRLGATWPYSKGYRGGQGRRRRGGAAAGRITGNRERWQSPPSTGSRPALTPPQCSDAHANHASWEPSREQRDCSAAEAPGTHWDPPHPAPDPRCQRRDEQSGNDDALQMEGLSQSSK